MSGNTGKRRRRAVRISEVDRRLIDEGLPPSWEDKVRSGSDGDVIDEGGAPASGGNDDRLLSEVPPHYRPPA